MRKKITFLTFLITFAFSSFCFAQSGMTIKEYLEEALPPQEGRKIVLDEATGILTITDTPSNHKLIKELIKAFDIGTPQVMIETRFVEVVITNLDELGIEWYWHRRERPQETRVLEDIGVGNAPGFTDADTLLTDVDGVQWGRYDEAGNYEFFPEEGHGLDFFISKTTFSGSYLRAYLHALEQKGKANLLSAPRVTTLSGQIANMQVTRTFPYVSKVELENIGTAEWPIWVLKETIEEKTVGISLEVTPHVASGSKYITLDIHPIVDVLLDQRSIKPATTSLYEWAETVDAVTTSYTTTVNVPGVPDAVGWPVVDTRSTQTTVVARSGQTIILGGLIKEDEEVTEKKVPILGDIPLLGNLFRYKHVEREKKNLLIFITATLITPDGAEIR